MSDSQAYRFLLAISTYVSAAVLWEITDPDNKMSGEARMRQWENFKLDYVKFYAAMLFDMQERMVTTLNKMSFDFWKTTDTTWKKTHPWVDLDLARVHKGMARFESVSNMLTVYPDLSFMSGLGFDDFAMDEFRERTINSTNTAFRLANCMDPINLRRFLSVFKIL
jgi:hypothetical protein